jgi:hypothetical protein
MNKPLRISLIVLGILAGLILVASAVLLTNYPAEYLRRLITYQISDVNDYRIFPERAIQPAQVPSGSKSRPTRQLKKPGYRPGSARIR